MKLRVLMDACDQMCCCQCCANQCAAADRVNPGPGGGKVEVSSLEEATEITDGWQGRWIVQNEKGKILASGEDSSP